MVSWGIFCFVVVLPLCQQYGTGIRLIIPAHCCWGGLICKHGNLLQACMLARADTRGFLAHWFGVPMFGSGFLWKMVYSASVSQDCWQLPGHVTSQHKTSRAEFMFPCFTCCINCVIVENVRFTQWLLTGFFTPSVNGLINRLLSGRII